jgi:hypothetical protein
MAAGRIIERARKRIAWDRGDMVLLESRAREDYQR